MTEPRDAKADLAQVDDINCLGEFNEFATEALPYWINRAVEAERLLELAGHVPEMADGAIRHLEKERDALAAKLKEAEAREGELWEALQVLFECHSEGGFVEPNEDVLKQAGQALSRPRPAILDHLGRLEKVYRSYLDMETPGRVDEEIPDDKEVAYEKGYKDAVFDFTSDMEQALEGSDPDA